MSTGHVALSNNAHIPHRGSWQPFGCFLSRMMYLQTLQHVVRYHVFFATAHLNDTPGRMVTCGSWHIFFGTCMGHNMMNTWSEIREREIVKNQLDAYCGTPDVSSHHEIRPTAVHHTVRHPKKEELHSLYKNTKQT